MTRPPFSLSHSSMRALICGFLFWQRYVLSDSPEPTSVPAYIGTAGHELIAEQIGHCARTQQRRDWDHFVEIVTARTDNEPEYIAERLLNVLQHFRSFKLPKAKEHYVERLLAVDRNWQPVAMKEAPDGPYWDKANHRACNLSVDIVTGQIDYFAPRARYIEAFDWKCGEEHLELDDVKDDPQAILYSALLLAHYPAMNFVRFRKWGIKYGAENFSVWDFRRDWVIPEAQKRTEYYFNKLDTLWRISEIDPAAPWPEQPHSRVNCQYCTAAAKCPRNRRLLTELEVLPPIEIPNRRQVKTLIKELAA